MPTAEVIAQIKRAFANTPYPGDDFDAISAIPHDEDIVQYFRGTSWQGHNVRNLRYHYDALCSFTDAAFRYWLPAFMLAELESPEEADIIAEFIAGSVTNQPNRATAFNDQALRALVVFLRECEARYGAPGAYDRFRAAADEVERCITHRGSEGY